MVAARWQRTLAWQQPIEAGGHFPLLAIIQFRINTDPLVQIISSAAAPRTLDAPDALKREGGLRLDRLSNEWRRTGRRHSS